jgi:hypothetical protein
MDWQAPQTVSVGMGVAPGLYDPQRWLMGLARGRQKGMTMRLA